MDSDVELKISFRFLELSENQATALKNSMTVIYELVHLLALLLEIKYVESKQLLQRFINRVVKYRLQKDLSCMMGNYHVQFLGGNGS